MDVLVNATTLVKGGGIQVAASFIAESIKQDVGIRWHYAIAKEVADELTALGVMLPDAHVFHSSPTRDKAQRERLLALERRLSPAVVFSVFGPAYMRFKSPHLCGVAVGWVTHSTWLAFASLPGWPARMRTLLMCVYKGFWLRFADRWVVEADNARAGLHRRVRVPLKKIDVVPNTCAAVFSEANMAKAVRPQSSEVVRLLYVSAYYPHKNIEFIPDVAAALKKVVPERRFEFSVTLPESEPGLQRLLTRARELGVESMIRNVGRVSLKQIIDLYKDAHICFMPSLLETFSATYPEAMALGRPIVTSDLDFSHATCGDAAVYFSAGNAVSAAEAIAGLLDSGDVWENSIDNGYQVLAGLPDAQRKFQLYVEAIRATAKP